MRVDPKLLAQEAKAIVLLAFRNGLLEDLHGGRQLPPLFSVAAEDWMTAVKPHLAERTERSTKWRSAAI